MKNYFNRVIQTTIYISSYTFFVIDFIHSYRKEKKEFTNKMKN